MRGPRDQRVRIEQVSLAADDWGQPTAATWSEYKTVWARVMTTRGKEFVSNGNMDTAQRRISVITEYTSGVTEKMRVVWDGRNYEIVGVSDQYRENETQIDAVYTEGRA